MNFYKNTRVKSGGRRLHIIDNYAPNGTGGGLHMRARFFQTSRKSHKLIRK